MRAADPVAEIDGGNDMTFDVSRSRATLVFGTFIIVLMWALTTLAVVMAAAEIRAGGKMEGPLIGFLGVLLFAFPSIRNSIPNSPPLGVLSDFVAYFWCEIILGLTLVTTLVFTAKPRFQTQ